MNSFISTSFEFNNTTTVLLQEYFRYKITHKMLYDVNRKSGEYHSESIRRARYLPIQWGCPRGVMVKAMNCEIVVSEFVLQSRYYVHFRVNTLGKGMNPLILSAMG